MAYIFMDGFDTYTAQELADIKVKGAMAFSKTPAVPSKTPPQSKPTQVSYAHHLTGQQQHKSKPVEGSTHTSHKKDGAETAPVTSSETVHKGVLTDGHSITVVGGRTLNLGNYESARIEVHITVPCDKNTINEAYDMATDWVDQKIEENIKTIKP